MAKIMDKATSKPRMVNTTRCWVWEVIHLEWSERSDDYTEEIKAVFFDPCKACQWAIQNYNIGAAIHASIYHIDSCK